MIGSASDHLFRHSGYTFSRQLAKLAKLALPHRIFRFLCVFRCRNSKPAVHPLVPGVPNAAGVLNVIHGGKEAVDFVCDAPEVKAISFVGGNQVGWCWSCSFCGEEIRLVVVGGGAAVVAWPRQMLRPLAPLASV